MSESGSPLGSTGGARAPGGKSDVHGQFSLAAHQQTAISGGTQEANSRVATTLGVCLRALRDAAAQRQAVSP